MPRPSARFWSRGIKPSAASPMDWCWRTGRQRRKPELISKLNGMLNECGREQNQVGRRKTSAFEDLVDLIAMLPWWAGVAAAGGFYLWLHNLASGEIAVATQPGQAGQMVSQALWKGLAIPIAVRPLTGNRWQNRVLD